jgi:uncharacterized membrane protein (UPF0127 family)
VLLASCISDAGATTTTNVEVTTTPVVESPFFDGDTARVVVGGEELTVAVADTSAERSQGLRGVSDLGDLDGMWFIHDAVGPVSYTMQQTLIPLDIWFIDGDGLIVGTTEMVPCQADPCPSYPSPAPVLWVLETELGRYDFATGDVVTVD